MGTNVQHHRIDLRGLAIRGAIAGVISAVVMGIVVMALTPAVSSGLDAWSFPKCVATIVMGTGAAQPITGFEAGPVIVGAILHLVIGGIVGAVFAMLVGFFDIEEPAPIVIGGLVYGAAVYLVTWVLLGNIAFTALSSLPVVVVFCSHVIFGLIAGSVLAHWEQLYDLDGPTFEGLDL